MKTWRILLGLVLALMLQGLGPRPAHADITLNPTDDSFVRAQLDQRDVNFDEDNGQVLVTAQGFPPSSPYDIGYLRFDLSYVRGTSVAEASLRLFGRLAAPDDVEVAIFAVNSDDWNGAAAGMGDETTLTYNTAPARTAQLDGSLFGDGLERWWVYGWPALASYVEAQLPDNGGDGYLTICIVVISTGMVDIQSFVDHETGATTGQTAELVLLGQPVAVELSRFEARSGSGGILLEWETASEVDTLGFNLVRALDPSGSGTVVNAAFIPGQLPGTPGGGQYQYLDAGVKPGLTYYYWLEELDTWGRATRYGPESALAPATARRLPPRRQVPSPVQYLPPNLPGPGEQ